MGLKTNNLGIDDGIALLERYDLAKTTVPIVQGVILGVVLVLAVLARVADAKTAQRVTSYARKRFKDTGEVISGSVVRLAFVETLLLPYTLLKRAKRDKKNKILSEAMARKTPNQSPAANPDQLPAELSLPVQADTHEQVADAVNMTPKTQAPTVDA